MQFVAIKTNAAVSILVFVFWAHVYISVACLYLGMGLLGWICVCSALVDNAEPFTEVVVPVHCH